MGIDVEGALGEAEPDEFVEHEGERAVGGGLRGRSIRRISIVRYPH